MGDLWPERVPVPLRWYGAADVPERPGRPGLNDRSVTRLLTEALYAQRDRGMFPVCAREMMEASHLRYDDDGEEINPADYACLDKDPRWVEAQAEADRLLSEHPWLDSLLHHHAHVTEQRLAAFAIDHLYDGSGLWEGDAFAFLLEWLDEAGTVLWSPRHARDDAHRERIEELRAGLLRGMLRERDPALFDLLRQNYEGGLEDGLREGRAEYRAPVFLGAVRAEAAAMSVAALVAGAVVGWVARSRR
jgi:hypothetical protein